MYVFTYLGTKTEVLFSLDKNKYYKSSTKQQLLWWHSHIWISTAT